MSQTHVEALEEEKNRLGAQIDDLIMESRTLLQLKMSLGLEVATYRFTIFLHVASLSMTTSVYSLLPQSKKALTM